VFNRREGGKGVSVELHASRFLERRVGVDQKLLEVGLEPLTSLRSRLEGIRVAAVVVVASSRGVAGAVGFTAVPRYVSHVNNVLQIGGHLPRLDPDNCILNFKAGVAGGAHSKSGTNSVAPMALLELSGRPTMR